MPHSRGGVRRYRRECWEMPDGRQIVGPLSEGIVGGYDPHLRRLILMLHVQGQMTCERIVALARYNAARSFGHWRFTMARNVGQVRTISTRR